MKFCKTPILTKKPYKNCFKLQLKLKVKILNSGMMISMMKSMMMKKKTIMRCMKIAVKMMILTIAKMKMNNLKKVATISMKMMKCLIAMGSILIFLDRTIYKTIVNLVRKTNFQECVQTRHTMGL